MRIFFFLLLDLFCLSSHSQQYEYHYLNPEDSSYNCYLLRFPDTEKARGLVVRDFSSLPDTSKQNPYKFEQLCAENGLMTVYAVTSSNFPEFYFSDAPAVILDEILHEVITAHKIPTGNIFTGGISASGSRALKFAQFCQEGKSKYGHRIKATFMVDSPLDLERFYQSIHLHKENFSDGMLWEANFMEKVFKEKLGGSPDEYPARYRKVSVYSHSDPKGGNAVHFADLPLMIFHEPDINWWIEERGASYYDINSYDIAGFVLKLKDLGNGNIELVTTSGQGFDRQGNRKPHSWTIVDEKRLVSWLTQYLN